MDKIDKVLECKLAKANKSIDLLCILKASVNDGKIDDIYNSDTLPRIDLDFDSEYDIMIYCSVKKILEMIHQKYRSEYISHEIDILLSNFAMYKRWIENIIKFKGQHQSLFGGINMKL